jgi:predicted transcriptional regulator
MGIVMKKREVKQFDEKEEEITDALISLGMNRPVARTLSYLQNINEATSRELETGTGLRQPEVSIATQHLEGRNWITEREEKKIQGKGRPNKIYSLKVGFNDIIAQLEKQQKKAVDEAQAKIERLKELGK